jgi:hypothetical protein
VLLRSDNSQYVVPGLSPEFRFRNQQSLSHGSSLVVHLSPSMPVSLPSPAIFGPDPDGKEDTLGRSDTGQLRPRAAGSLSLSSDLAGLGLDGGGAHGGNGTASGLPGRSRTRVSGTARAARSISRRLSGFQRPTPGMAHAASCLSPRVSVSGGSGLRPDAQVWDVQADRRALSTDLRRADAATHSEVATGEFTNSSDLRGTHRRAVDQVNRELPGLALRARVADRRRSFQSFSQLLPERTAYPAGCVQRTRATATSSDRRCA